MHAAPATLVARPAPGGTTTFVESLRTVCGARAAESVCVRFTLRCACNSACDGRAAAPVCMPMQWKTRGNHRSVAASAYDALRRSKLKFAGRRFHERSLRAVDPNRSLASADVAKLGGSQAALHRPSAPSSECCCTNPGQTGPRSTTVAPSQAGGLRLSDTLPASLMGRHFGI